MARDGSGGTGYVDVLRAACQDICERTAAERVSVWVHDERARAVSPLVSVGARVPDAEVARRWSRLPVRELGVLGDVLVARSAIRIADVEASDLPVALRRDFALTSGWFAPLVVDDQAVGLLVVEPSDVIVEDTAVEPVAAALAMARSRYLADRRQAELELLIDLTRTAVEPGGAGGAIEHLCQRLARHLGVQRACVFLAEDDELVAAHAYNADGSVDLDGFRAFVTTASPPPIVEAAFRGWETLVVDEPAPAIVGDWWVERFGVGSGLAIPIGTAEEPMGVLTLDDPRPRRFSDGVVRLAEAAAAHFGVLYERARLLDEHARGVRSGLAVQELLRAGSRAHSAARAVEIAAEVAREALDAEHACGLLVDPQGTIEHVVTVAIDEPWRGQLHEHCIGARLEEVSSGMASAPTRAPVVVADIATSDLIPAQLLDGLPVRSFVALPLTVASRLRGWLLLTASRHQCRWSRADLHLIQQLMLECELVLENATLREAEAARTEQLGWQAMHDPLTGLPNRALVGDRLDAAVRATSRDGRQVAVLFIDLHRFKDVNDEWGHETGDLVLVELASRFTASLRPGDTVGRLAGDEFVVVLPQATPREAETVAGRICDVTREPIALAGRQVRVGASIGVALGDRSTTGESLLRRADAAMYAVKRATGHGYQVAPIDEGATHETAER